MAVDDFMRFGTKLIPWLDRPAVTPMEDFLSFGPEAARVRALLDYLPTISDDAAAIGYYADKAIPKENLMADEESAYIISELAGRQDELERAGLKAFTMYGDGVGNTRDVSPRVRPRYWRNSGRMVRNAGWAEAVNDLLPPWQYEALTNPLATGRLFGELQSRLPSRFSNIARDLSERRLIARPADVLTASGFLLSPQKEQDALMETLLALVPEGGLAESGFNSLQDIIDAARLLG